jgi:DNA-binding CsgD family transcriptional regulator
MAKGGESVERHGGLPLPSCHIPELPSCAANDTDRGLAVVGEIEPRPVAGALRSEPGALVDVARAAARAGGRASEQEGEGWRAIVSGEWSVVDSADRDGKRFLVARRTTSAASALADDELQVLALAAQAHGYKQIASELETSISSVCERLRRGLRKLGLRSRTELVAICAGSQSQ